jgi:hypothetical protein
MDCRNRFEAFSGRSSCQRLGVVADVCAVAAGRCPQCGFGPLGLFHALEVKAGNGKPTESQLALRHAINNAGGFATIAVGLDPAIQALEHWRLLRGRMA